MIILMVILWYIDCFWEIYLLDSYISNGNIQYTIIVYSFERRENMFWVEQKKNGRSILNDLFGGQVLMQ